MPFLAKRRLGQVELLHLQGELERGVCASGHAVEQAASRGRQPRSTPRGRHKATWPGIVTVSEIVAAAIRTGPQRSSQATCSAASAPQRSRRLLIEESPLADMLGHGVEHRQTFPRGTARRGQDRSCEWRPRRAFPCQRLKTPRTAIVAPARRPSATYKPEPGQHRGGADPQRHGRQARGGATGLLEGQPPVGGRGFSIRVAERQAVNSPPGLPANPFRARPFHQLLRALLCRYARSFPVP
jgi:hypothetical protein